MCVGTGTAARARVRTPCCGDHVLRQAYGIYCSPPPRSASNFFIFFLAPCPGRSRFFLGRGGAGDGAGGGARRNGGRRRGAGDAGRAWRLRGILPPFSIFRFAAGRCCSGLATTAVVVGVGPPSRCGAGAGAGAAASGLRARDLAASTASPSSCA